MKKPTKLQISTLRDFGGGLNLLDNDLSLKLTFAKVLDNFYRAPDGSLSLRYGIHDFWGYEAEPVLASMSIAATDADKLEGSTPFLPKQGRQIQVRYMAAAENGAITNGVGISNQNIVTALVVPEAQKAAAMQQIGFVMDDTGIGVSVFQQLVSSTYQFTMWSTNDFGYTWNQSTTNDFITALNTSSHYMANGFTYPSCILTVGPYSQFMAVMWTDDLDSDNGIVYYLSYDAVTWTRGADYALNFVTGNVTDIENYTFPTPISSSTPISVSYTDTLSFYFVGVDGSSAIANESGNEKGCVFGSIVHTPTDKWTPCLMDSGTPATEEGKALRRLFAKGCRAVDTTIFDVYLYVNTVWVLAAPGPSGTCAEYPDGISPIIHSTPNIRVPIPNWTDVALFAPMGVDNVEIIGTEKTRALFGYSGEIHCVTESGTVYVKRFISGGGGWTWTRLGDVKTLNATVPDWTVDTKSVILTDSLQVFMVAKDGSDAPTVFYSDDFGETWNEIPEFQTLGLLKDVYAHIFVEGYTKYRPVA